MVCTVLIRSKARESWWMRKEETAPDVIPSYSFSSLTAQRKPCPNSRERMGLGTEGFTWTTRGRTRIVIQGDAVNPSRPF